MVCFAFVCLIFVAYQAPVLEKSDVVLQRDASVELLRSHFVSIRFRTSCGCHWLMRHSRARQLAVSIALAFERDEGDFSRLYKLYLCEVLVNRAFHVMAIRHCVVAPL